MKTKHHTARTISGKSGYLTTAIPHRFPFHILIFFLIAIPAKAQNRNYRTAMQTYINRMDTTYSTAALNEIAGGFERIGITEATQWLPFYYAAFCKIIPLFIKPDPDIDIKAIQIEELIDKAETSGGDLSETYCLRSYLSTLKMLASPQSRYATEGKKAVEYLKKAIEINPENPRAYLILGENLLHTPEAFGGGYKAAAPVLKKAKTLFENIKPENDLRPSWGKKHLKKLESPVTSKEPPSGRN